MTMTARKTTETFTAPGRTFDVQASNGLPGFYHEFATAEVEGIGEVRIGISANMLGAYVMMPYGDDKAFGRSSAKPHLFAAKMSDLLQPLLAAAVERFKAGHSIDEAA